jgi:hypothetical protein
MVARRILVCLAVAALAAPACGGDGDAATTTAPPATTAAPATSTTPATELPATTSTPTTSAAPSTTGAAVGVSIDVVVTDDGVDAEERYDVPLGGEVTITVTSTFADEVHVHSYDLFAPLEPDVPGRITFVADVPGVFEVELENAGVPLFELVVE